MDKSLFCIPRDAYLTHIIPILDQCGIIADKDHSDCCVYGRSVRNLDFFFLSTNIFSPLLGEFPVILFLSIKSNVGIILKVKDGFVGGDLIEDIYTHKISTKDAIAKLQEDKNSFVFHFINKQVR